jgi:Fe2+ or Zn2+ uptake regulation protein
MADNFTQIKNELIRSTKLTPKEKAVLFVLLSYGDCEEIYLNQKTLAKQANTSRASVIRALDKLRKLKMINTTIKPDRSTLLYELSTGVVVSHSNKVVAQSDRGCTTQQQGVVAQSDTSNKSISNKTIDKKDGLVKDEIITKVILLWNDISGKNKNLNPTTQQYRKAVSWCLKQFNGLSDSEKLAKFRFVFENKKRMYEDPDHIFSHFELPTLLRQGKFMGNVDAAPYKQAVDHRTPAEIRQAMEDEKNDQARP